MLVRVPARGGVTHHTRVQSLFPRRLHRRVAQDECHMPLVPEHAGGVRFVHAIGRVASIIIVFAFDTSLGWNGACRLYISRSLWLGGSRVLSIIVFLVFQILVRFLFLEIILET